MFWRMPRSRPKSSKTLPQGVQPLLEFLEGRESPSAFQPNRLLAASLAEPLANAAMTYAEPAGQRPRPATLDQAAAPAGALSDNGFPTVVPLASLAPVGVGLETNPAGVGNLGGGPLNNYRPTRQHQAPEITDFRAIEGEDGWWTFEGSAVADNTSGLVVRFGGLPSLKGQAVPVQKDGTFQLCIQLQNGEEGMATAQTTDWRGQDSNVAQTWVHQTNGGNSVHK